MSTTSTLPPALHEPTAFSAIPQTRAGLLAYTLRRAGMPADIAIHRDSVATLPSPRFTAHLPAALPVDTLLHALQLLQGKRGGHGMLLLGAAPSSHPYREHLQLNDANQVIAIRRSFRKQHGHRGKPRLKLLGVLCKSGDRFPADSISTPVWRTARLLLRRHPGALRRILPTADPRLDDANPYFIGPSRASPHPAHHTAKRLFDILFSLFALLLTLPLCLLTALVIKLYDRGPIFFAHTRESLHGRPFPCLKFRTMVANANSLQNALRTQNQVDGPQFKIARDPRITPIGHFLRKTNIDELPQFLNVLAGHMSVVGPRPSPFEENQLCPAWREARLSVKPGITGLWQISRNRQRGPTDFQEWIYFDTQYVERQSLWLDTRILLLTIKELFGHGQ